MPAAIANGLRLNYVERGEGPPLLLTHGLQSSSFIWTPALDSLAERFRVIAWDMRGHGDSDKPSGPYRIQDFSDDMAALSMLSKLIG
jgi:3-oxoadipate enol-lactonase